jgi:tRNA(Ile)-lysidine synthase
MSTHSKPFSPQNFLSTIRHTVAVFHMLEKGDSVLVGVSGGADSIALLHALVEISKTCQLRLGVAHLNHGLRGFESDADESFVQSAAGELGLPCFIEQKNVFHDHSSKRISLEEAGRDARYHFFNEVADRERFDKIAVGHHRDDSAELILINLIRGSGPSGLKGIMPVRGKIIRPFIHVSRESILSYLKHNQLQYRIDSSNSDERFIRNKIRHHLIPLLKSHYNPNISESLNRLGDILRLEDEWFSQYIDSVMEPCIQSKDHHSIVLSIDEIQKHHIALQKRVIRHAVRHAKGDLRRVTYAHVDAVLELMLKAGQDLLLDLPGRIRIFKQNSQLRISREKKSLRLIGCSEKIEPPIGFEYTISAMDINADPLIIKEVELGLKFKKLNRVDVMNLNNPSGNMAFFDWDCLVFPLKVRNYREGDSFIPLGMKGTQRIKKYFINNKISRLKRFRVPMLLSENKIIWVVGERISDHVKVTPETKSVLSAERFVPRNDRSPG